VLLSLLLLPQQCHTTAAALLLKQLFTHLAVYLVDVRAGLAAVPELLCKVTKLHCKAQASSSSSEQGEPAAVFSVMLLAGHADLRLIL
jgi:hypothetical protein